MASNSSSDYQELSVEQVLAAHKDALRQVEHGHLQASLQRELATGVTAPDTQRVEVLDRQLTDYDAQRKLLLARIKGLPAQPSDN